MVWLVAPSTVIGCLYLFFSLPPVTRWSFLAWNVLGIVVYVLWARHQGDPAAGGLPSKEG
ncbi:hypothetical protein D3C72_2393820 [compost metagenome]